jgi:hypothetical protein
MKKLLKFSAVAVLLALTAFSANAKGGKAPKAPKGEAAKMSIADCNSKCTAEAAKSGDVKLLKACFKGCPGSEIGDMSAAAAEHFECKNKANRSKPGCQIALDMGGKWFLDVINDQTPTGEELRKLVVKADGEDK